MLPTKFRLEPAFHPEQRKVFDSTARFRIVMAGRRSGKTYFTLWDAIIFAFQHPHSSIWYIAPSYGQAKAIAWRKLINLLPQEAISKIHETELYIHLINETRIELKGCDHEDSLRGRGPDYVILDETAFMKQHIWEEIIQPSLLDKKGKAVLIGTPDGKNWFWRLWQSANAKLDESFEAFRFTTFDNPHLPEEALISARLQTKNSLIFKQEYMAEPQSREGLVYPEFNQAIHVVRPFEISKEARLFRAIDWGIQAPCVCLWGALLPGGDLFIYREHSRNGLPAPRQAEIIKGLTGMEKIEVTIIDPSTKKRESKSAPQPYFESIQMQFTRAGIPTILGYNPILDGISVVKNMLLMEKLHIFETCPGLLMELLTYEWAKAAEGDGANPNEKPKDGGDDCCDALKYLCCFVNGKAASGLAIDTPQRNCTIAEDAFLVDYGENGEITGVRHRKMLPGNYGGSRINEYGGLMQ